MSVAESTVDFSASLHQTYARMLEMRFDVDEDLAKRLESTRQSAVKPINTEAQRSSYFGTFSLVAASTLLIMGRASSEPSAESYVYSKSKLEVT